MAKLRCELAAFTSINKRTGDFEVYCAKYGKHIKGNLPDIINSAFSLNDKVKIYIDILPYTLRIKMISKAR